MTSSQMRVGLGHDTHRLASGHELWLGGVRIDFDLGLVGHSDADVLLHAVTDALLGAAGLGDIGEWFPNSDPRWAQADSAQFVSEALAALRERDWQIENLDCTVFAERPKLKPYKAAINKRLANLLQVEENQINVKAKTGEAVGTIGRGEAIGASAIVLLTKRDRHNKE